MIQTLEHNHFTLVGLSRLMCRSFVTWLRWMQHSMYEFMDVT